MSLDYRPAMSWKWIVDGRDGDLRIDWKRLVASLLAGVVTLFLLQMVLSGWARALTVGVLGVVAITVDTMLRRRPSGVLPRER